MRSTANYTTKFNWIESHSKWISKQEIASTPTKSFKTTEVYYIDKTIDNYLSRMNLENYMGDVG